MSNIIYISKPKPLFTTIKYGLLYNWYAAIDSRNIAAIGWNVPTASDGYNHPELSDFGILVSYAGSNGGKLKEIGLLHWEIPNTGATNEYQFNARGAGQRSISGTFKFLYINQTLHLWSKDAYWGNSYTGRILYAAKFDINSLELPPGGTYKYEGHSIRLIKDSTTLTHGQTGTYTGNDGKVYRTICIGNQEWLADNLAETKYRNGDHIPEVTDNAAWAALTTGALCAYENNWNNV